jgi:hypothetical protein
MSSISEELSRLVKQRANDRCEYCLVPNGYGFQPHHVDHIRARKHDGTTVPDNLCLSCYLCNLHKGSDASGFDPITDELVRLYNPRVDQWHEHFQLIEARIEGLTKIGRATVKLLQMNLEERVVLRKELIRLSLYP